MPVPPPAQAADQRAKPSIGIAGSRQVSGRRLGGADLGPNLALAVVGWTA
jgi:hypothetical protein